MWILCFYHAIALQLDDNYTGSDLQRLVMNEVLRNFQEYMGFIDGDHDSFFNYHTRSKQGESAGWADHIMIQATANLLNRPILIQLFDLQGNIDGDSVIISPALSQTAVTEPQLIIGNIANLDFVAHIPEVEFNDLLFENNLVLNFTQEEPPSLSEILNGEYSAFSNADYYI